MGKQTSERKSEKAIDREEEREIAAEDKYAGSAEGVCGPEMKVPQSE